VLERFEIPAELALALGALPHGVCWLSLTGSGLAALRRSHTSLGELDGAAGP
jgi:hypothetical protein